MEEIAKETIEEIVDETVEEIQEEKYSYKADILLAKKSAFESKLYVHLLNALGYTYEVANNLKELQDLTQQFTYKLVLFDKEFEGLDLKEFSSSIKHANAVKNLSTYLVLINDTSMPENKDDALYVHEMLKNSVNKDLLRLVFEKFI